VTAASVERCRNNGKIEKEEIKAKFSEAVWDGSRMSFS
jgi:hypothetical protein